MFLFDLPNEPLDHQNKSAFHYFLSQEQCGFSSILAGVIKIPPKQMNKSYAELPGKDQVDRDKIIKLFTAMGTQGKLALLKKRNELEKLGQEIDHVHPLKMLGCAFSNPHMQEYFDQIYNDYFKWKKFYEGFAPRMNHEALKNNLACYLNDFAKEVNLDPANLKPFFESKDWEGFIKYLIYTKR
jgi:hypothetical protein